MYWGRSARSRPSRRRWAISSPTASASGGEVISLPVVVEDGDSYNCFWRMPFRKSVQDRDRSIRATSRSACSTTTSTGSSRTRCPTTRRISTPSIGRSIRSSRAGLRVPRHRKARAITWAPCWRARTRSPAWFGEGGREVLHRRRGKPSIWGTGTEDYFLSAWGLKK